MAEGLLYHLTYQNSKYFLNITQTFDEGVNSNVELDAGFEFHLKENDIDVAVLTKNNGVVEYEYSAGEYRYIISDYEVTHLDTDELSGEWIAASGGNSVTPTTVTITADTELGGSTMSVSSCSVADGATDVDIKPAILITFDSDLNQNTVTIPGFKLLDLDRKTAVNTAIRVTADNQVEVVPAVSLRPSTRYRIFVPGGSENYAPQSVDGEKLAQNYRVQFRTGEDTYTSVSEVSEPNRIERTAPVRVSSAYSPPVEGQTTPVTLNNGKLSWTKVNQPRATTVSIKFSEALEDPVDLSELDIEVSAVLGDDKFYSDTEDALFYPTAPETVPAVSTVEVNDVNDKQLDIVFDEELYYNTVIVVTFNALSFASGSTFTGSYKHLIRMTPICATLPAIKFELSGFLSTSFTDSDLLMYLHSTAVEERLRYGAPPESCKMVYRRVCILKAALRLMDNWIATTAAIGSNKSLGDFSVSSIPRPELIIGSKMSPGPYRRKIEELEAEMRTYSSCRGNVSSSNYYSESSVYPTGELRLRTELLDFTYQDRLAGFNERV